MPASSKGSSRRWPNERETALLIGGLLVVGVLGFGYPWFMRARQMAAKAHCSNYLRQIDGAKEGWALQNNKTWDSLPRRDDLLKPAGYINEMPVCPGGGRYTLGRMAQKPKCSIPAHNFSETPIVTVVDEDRVPVAGAFVVVEGAQIRMDQAFSDQNGQAAINFLQTDPRFSTNDLSQGQNIIVTKTGFEMGTMHLPSPVSSTSITVTLQRAH